MFFTQALGGRLDQVLQRHLVLMRPGFEASLRDEFLDRFDLNGEVICRAGVGFSDSLRLPRVRDSVFARQLMPRARVFTEADQDCLAKLIFERISVLTRRSNRQSGVWTLHAFAIDDDDQLARAKKIGKVVMQLLREKHKGFVARYVVPEEFARTERSPHDVIIQLYASGPCEMWLSAAALADGLSPWEAGFQRMKTLAGAPSRSASKLEEALLVLGEFPKRGQTAVDLGAAPGGWSYVLAHHGAHVTAIDHANLDLPRMGKLKGQIIHRRENGLKFLPATPVDWLVCDMVIGYRETLRVLQAWLDADAMQYFVVNVKLPKSKHWPMVKEALSLIEGYGWGVVTGQHLLHDRSEITLLGRRTVR